ncbi:MAG TPA: AarF/ABC1/UbiB kinase family protein [Pseudonocardia sp.]|nr:AarF/ABC1/UbiB kinase family protein [Pseudonocardia sp.]
MTDPRMRTARRALKLTSLPLGFAGRAAGGWARGASGGDRTAIAAQLAVRNADQLFAVLGELKGGAMKVGQALSVYEALIPNELAEPYHQALIKLQASAPPMPAKDVHRVLDEQLGRQWPSRFREFDAEAAHAASIGQVHKATWHDGRQVAVKLQYPGAEQALTSDLRILRRLAQLLKIIVPGMDVRALIDELTTKMAVELDYAAEADHQRTFAEALADDPRIRVPKVVASAPKVIVSEWLEGIPLSHFARTPVADEHDQDVRDHIGETMLEWVFSSPRRTGLLHCDPHHGNFRLMPDGRIGALDFGAVVPMPGGIPAPLAHLLQLAADDRAEEFLQASKDAGFIAQDHPITPTEAMSFLGAFPATVRDERFHFTRSFMQNEGARLTDIHGDFQTVRALDLPPDYLMLARTVGGWVGILAQIDCTVSTREILRTWVPGFVG